MAESRQQSNRGGNIRGGQGIPGCTNPNALNFNPTATGCPFDNPACCIFEEPPSWDCEPFGQELQECYGPIQSSQQSFIFVCANRSDCAFGCLDGPNEDFSNYCNNEEFGMVWYNESCCSNDSYPINAEYWDVNNNMNFPTLESAYDENITWEPHDSIFFINCGNNGTECISNDPEWLFGLEANSRIYSHVYIPAGGYQNAYPVMSSGYSPTDGYVRGAGFMFPLIMYEPDSYGNYDNYPSPGDRIDMMIYKRSRGLLYRTDNFDGNSGNLIFPKVLADNDEFQYWPDEFRVPALNSVGNFTKVFPTGGVQIVGCTDPEAYNYNPQAQIQEQGQCNYDFPKEGCTNSMCENYDLEAVIDDGSCYGCFGEEPTPDYSDMPVGGCMDERANNYNPNATYDNGTCDYSTMSYISCQGYTSGSEANAYCQSVLSSTYRCSTNENNERMCMDFAGDVSGDDVLDYMDLCMMASHILQTPIQHELCSGLVGAGGVNPSTVFTDPISPDMIQFGDIDGDGVISIFDFIAVTNLFVYQTFDTYSDINQALDEIETMFGLSDYVLRNQGQSRPPRPLPPQDRQLQTLKQLPNDKTRRLFRNVYPLSEEESNMIKDYDLIPNDLKDIDGNIQCLGENNSYPCYWVPLSGINIDVSSDISIPSPLSNENLTTTTRNNVSLSIDMSHYNTGYLFNLDELERNYKMTITSDYLILARCNGVTTGFLDIKDPIHRNVIVSSQLYDGENHTRKYCKVDETPKFYLHNKTNNREIKIRHKSKV